MKISNEKKLWLLLSLICMSLIVVFLYRKGIFLWKNGRNIDTLFYDDNNIPEIEQAKYYYVQTINDKYESEVKQFADVINSFKSDDVVFIAIENGEYYKYINESHSNVIYISYDIENDYVKEAWSKQGYFIYGKNKNEIVYMKNNDYSNGPKIDLLRVINNDTFRASSYFTLKKTTNYFDKYISGMKYEKYIAVLLTDICSGCASGGFLKYFNDYNNNHKDIYVFAVLLGDLKECNIKAISSQLNLSIDIYIGNSDLDNMYKNIINKYNKENANNVIISMNSSHVIEYIYDNNCNCWEYFKENIEKDRGKSPNYSKGGRV